MLRTRGGFTLIEVMITVVIIGILAAIALPSYGRARERSYWQEAESLLLAIYAGERAYFLVNDAYFDVDESKTGAARMAEWRKINIDDPNLPSIPVSYSVGGVAGPGATATFTATATRAAGGPCAGAPTRTIDHNRALTSGSCWCGSC